VKRHVPAAPIATLAVVLLAAALALSGCAEAKQAVKTTVEQGIEPTSTGPHTTGLGNAAQNAVDAANAAKQQTQQNAQDAAGSAAAAQQQLEQGTQPAGQ
jgi:PBP1b-binding outer membrane lipoprotein LpoB